LTRLPLTPESPSIDAALLAFSEASVGTTAALPFELVDLLLEELLELDVLEADVPDELDVLAGAATGLNV